MTLTLLIFIISLCYGALIINLCYRILLKKPVKKVHTFYGIFGYPRSLCFQQKTSRGMITTYCSNLGNHPPKEFNGEKIVSSFGICIPP
jgi:hypothetical protein